MAVKQKKPKKLESAPITVAQHKQQERIICIPIIAVQGAALFLCLLILLMAGSFFYYSQTTQSVASTETNSVEIEQLTKTIVGLQADLKRLNSLNAEIRGIINNEDTTPSQTISVRPPANYKNQGGPQVRPDLNDVTKFVHNLQANIKIREQSLAELKQQVLARQARLAATPSIWPVSGDVTSPFGWRNSPWGGGREWHPGIDIANNMETPIFATADGKVARGEWADGYGNLVQIDHGNDLSTLYGHNSRIIVHVGQFVKKGHVISYLGNTGNSTGPHVHYEIRVNGIAVNPESFLVLK